MARARRRVLSGWAAALGLAALAWGAGLVWFAQSIPRDVEDPDSTTDAIVVLTGSAGRLAAGLDLLERDRARKLFVSGVYRGVDVAQLLKVARRPGSDLECCLVLGHAADDTRGNAAETARWIAEEGYGSIRLVTANYHMRRSLLEFRRTMPAVRIVPHPVPQPEVMVHRWWTWPGTFQLVVTEYGKYLVALVRPW